MSRTPARYNMTVVRGSTWEDDFSYADENGDPIDLTGYEARMQVRTECGQYGTTTDSTLLADLSTTGTTPQLVWDTAAAGRLRIRVEAADTVALNPKNEEYVIQAYSIEVYLPESDEPEYVLPLVTGLLIVYGEVTR